MSGIDSWRSLREACEKYGATSITVPALVDALTAPMARVEALADEWERKADNAIAHDQVMRAGRLAHAARRLRAALDGAPSREGES